MKSLIICLLSFCLLNTFTANAKESGQATENYDLTVKFINKKGKPFKGQGVIAYIKGVNEYHSVPGSGIIGISGVDPADTLCIISASVAFEFPVMGLDSINVIMRNSRQIEGFYQEDRQEMLNYGYITVNKKRDTGAASAVDMSQAANYRTLLDFLHGRVPGVDVNPSAGTIQIRGVNSINSSTDPLVVLDGSPIDFRTANSVISPMDIESITIDKMGSLYGVRGANGVIIITTKKNL